MANIFDIILLVIPVVTVIICFSLGFFRLLKPFWKIAAFLLAWSLKGTALVTATVGKLINSEGMKSFIKGRVDAVWGEKIKAAAEADGVSLADRFDEAFGIFGSFFTNVKEFCVSLYGESVENAAESVPLSERVEAFVTDATAYATDAVVSFITQLIGFIILYAAFMVLFWLGARMLDSIFGDGILGLCNKLLGGAVGILYGMIAAWIVSIILVLAVPNIASCGVEQVTGGVMGVTEWFYTRFFLSQLLGLTI